MIDRPSMPFENAPDPVLPKICVRVQASLSEYLDGAVPGGEMMRMAAHFDSCTACAREYGMAWQMQQTLAALGTAKAPADLSLKLRLAVSREQQRGWSAVLSRLSLTWQNALQPLVLQASAGLACAIVFLGGVVFLLGAVGAANPVMANDEPLGAMTAPHYLYSVAGIRPVATSQEGTIVVEASVNARGEVYDYRIVSGPQDVGVRSQIVDRLLGSVFQPASVFGLPVRGQVIMTFAGVTVQG